MVVAALCAAAEPSARTVLAQGRPDASQIVCVTERVPLLDMARVRQALEGSRSRLVGPNSQAVLSPGLAQLGVVSTVDA
jgi:succinyl-CoA synthetase alpha subunit